MYKKLRTSDILSFSALLVSLLSIFIQSFWHKENLVIYTTNLIFDKNIIHADFVISNLGNHDEVIYKAFIGVENKLKIKDVDETDTLIIIKPGESKKLTATSPTIDFNETQHINFYIKLLSDKKLHKLKLAHYDTKIGELKYRLPNLELHSIKSAICGDCGDVKFDNIYNVRRN
ncbi:hypothetical protein ACK3YQ_01190 [Aeromonas caviae]